MLNEIHVLFEGYSYKSTEEKAQHANCTCTLIKGKDNYNVIVDTMTIWDKDRIISALASHNIQPKDIRVVISTHGHSDHTGNNNLFLEAEWHIMGESISNHDKYLTYNFRRAPFKLTDDISVMSTPGHTLSCVSVIVANTNLGQTIGICGDLFEREDDILDSSIWLEAGSENPVLQEENRMKITQIVNYIIPGHGKGFPVTDDIRTKLKTEFERNN